MIQWHYAASRTLYFVHLNFPGILIIPVPQADAVNAWLQQFTLSPGFAGMFAVAAAGIAVFGVHKQIRSSSELKTKELYALSQQQTKALEASAIQQTTALEAAAKQQQAALESATKQQATALEATARQKAEERWWVTLTWVYDKASLASSQADPLPKAVAAKVLNELLTTADPASPLQSQTVEALAGMFVTRGDVVDVNGNADQILRESIANLYTDLSKSNGRDAAFAYEAQVLAALGQYAGNFGLAFVTDFVRRGATLPDAVLVANGVGMAIEVKARPSNHPLQPQVLQQTRGFLGSTLTTRAGEHIRIVEATIVTNAPEAPRDRSNADDAGLRVVRWKSHDDDAQLFLPMDLFSRDLNSK